MKAMWELSFRRCKIFDDLGNILSLQHMGSAKLGKIKRE